MARSRSNQKTQPVLKILIFVIICGDALFLTGAVMYSLFSQWVTAHQAISPTEIPWIKTKEKCEHTDRVWQDDQCLDIDHSYLF